VRHGSTRKSAARIAASTGDWPIASTGSCGSIVADGHTKPTKSVGIFGPFPRAFAASASTVRPDDAATIASHFAAIAAWYACSAPAGVSRSSNAATSTGRPPTPPPADFQSAAALAPTSASLPQPASVPVIGPITATR
jgi:hypothetical protein